MTRISRILLTALFAASIVGFAHAQESTPKLKTVAAIFIRSEDVDDSKIEKELQGAFAKSLNEMVGVEVLEFGEALSPAAKTLIKDNNYKRLLEFPELIARSICIRRNLQTDGVFIGKIEMFGKQNKSYFISIALELYDIRGNDVIPFDLGNLDFRGEQERSAFIQSTAASIAERIQQAVPGMETIEQKTLHAEKVLCNTKSMLYHRKDSHHIAPNLTAQELDRPEAVKAGYRPCTICFPELRKGIDPQSTEAMLGAEVAGFIEYYYRVCTNPELNARVDRVGHQVLKANGFTKRNYVFTILNSSEINAFAAPAGYIYITTGMLDILESDDELACVLAHEIAHVEQEHGLKQYRRAQKAAAIGVLVSVISGQDVSIIAEFVRELVMRGYDRKYEKEADRYGYMYVRRTSFDPEMNLVLMGKLLDMELANDVKIVSWLRTHPKAEDRLKYINEYKADAEKAMQYISELDKIDTGIAAAVKDEPTGYINAIDSLKSFVDIVKTLP